MKRYALLAGAIGAVILATFFAAQALGWDLLEDPRPMLARLGPAAPLVSFTLLASDVLLPVPSSVLMMGNGALFGFAAGSLISTAGSLASAWLGFGIGRRSTGLVARLCTDAERRAMERLIERWGPFAVALTRPVPIAAETCTLIAGTTAMSWRALTLATLAGTVPPAAVYAYAGAYARDVSGVYVFVAVMAAAGLLYWVGRRTTAGL
jgi:uncharacterized membrane protein YdjX (TVP38/TMEM64 family)